MRNFRLLYSPRPDATTPRPSGFVICQEVPYRGSKITENFKRLALKVVEVVSFSLRGEGTATRRLRSFTRGGRLQEVPNIVIGLTNFWYFENYSLSRGGSLTRDRRNRRFVCSYVRFEITRVRVTRHPASSNLSLASVLALLNHNRCPCFSYPFR